MATTLPTNWWHDVPPEIPAAPLVAEERRREPQPAQDPPPAPAPVEWMRSTPAQSRRNGNMHASHARRERALRAADRMVDLGERLALWMVGFCAGSALVVLVNAVWGG